MIEYRNRDTQLLMQKLMEFCQANRHANTNQANAWLAQFDLRTNRVYFGKARALVWGEDALDPKTKKERGIHRAKVKALKNRDVLATIEDLQHRVKALEDKLR